MTFINRDGRKIWREKVTRAKCVASVFPNAYRINVEKKNYCRWSGTTKRVGWFQFLIPKSKISKSIPIFFAFYTQKFLIYYYKSCSSFFFFII